jgi:hypothetical protein
LWYRSTAIPWLQKSGVLAAAQQSGLSGGFNKLSAEIGPAVQSWSKTVGVDMNKTMSEFLLWVASNPVNFLIVGVGIVGVIMAIDWAITSFCTGGHSHSHSHSHVKGKGGDEGGSASDADRGKLARELERVDTAVAAAVEREHVRKEAEAAGAKVLKPAVAGKPGSKKAKTPEDVRGTVKSPATTSPKYSAFHVKDPILMLKRLGKWPPPAVTIIGGTPEAIEAARKTELDAKAPAAKAASKKGKTPKKGKRH